MRTTPFKNPAVKKIFDGFPAPARDKLLALRELIFAAAKKDPRIGQLEETIKWGEPSYVTTETKSGSTVRLGYKTLSNQYAVYFNCKTTLVKTFRETYGDLLKYEGNRAILFNAADDFPVEWLQDCILKALSYHVIAKQS